MPLIFEQSSGYKSYVPQKGLSHDKLPTRNIDKSLKKFVGGKQVNTFEIISPVA